MQKGLFVVVSLAVVALAAGQDKSPSSCPAISITGPAGVWLPGDPIWFLANVEANATDKLEYFWKVDKGRISAGQGTPRITVITPKGFDQHITATVEISGLPAGCPNSAFESAVEAIDNFEPILIRAIKSSTYRIQTGLLAVIEKSLRENPNSQLYVALHLDKDFSRTNLNMLTSAVLRQLATTKIDKTRFTVVPTRDGYRGFTFWRVPPGRSDPAVVPYTPES